MSKNRFLVRAPWLAVAALALILPVIGCTNPDRDGDQRTENAKEWGNNSREKADNEVEQPR